MSSIHRLSPIKHKKRNGQFFFCPFCAGNGTDVELKKVFVLEQKTLLEDVEIFDVVKSRGKWMHVATGAKKLQGETVVQKVKRFKCPKCGLVYPLKQFYGAKNADLRIKEH